VSIDRPFNSWDAVKLFALFLMVVDHAGFFLFPDEQWLRAIGRSAAPVFFFLAGYASSYRFRRDVLLLAIALAVSNFIVAGGELRPLNILFTIVAIRLLFDWMERYGKFVEKPWEWYIGSVALVASIIVIEYGSIGFLFALAGYLKRHAERYPPDLQRRFFVAAFVTYGSLQAFMAQYTPANAIVMGGLLLAVGGWLYRLEVRPIDTSRIPAWLAQTGKFVARHSAWFYVLHIVILQWITMKPL
jgi:hypothetical protein